MGAYAVYKIFPSDRPLVKLRYLASSDDLERVENLTFSNTVGWVVDDIPCISRYRNVHTLIDRKSTRLNSSHVD